MNNYIEIKKEIIYNKLQYLNHKLHTKESDDKFKRDFNG